MLQLGRNARCCKEDKELKSRVNDAHDAFVRSLHASARRRRLKIMVVVILLLIAVAAVIIVRMIMKHNREVEAAKKSLVQFDINSTFKEAEFPPQGDWDEDGLKNQTEKDGIEIEFQGKKEVVKPNVQSIDSDSDGISDGDEIALGLNPLNEDTDGDGIIDGYELISGLNPKRQCTDENTPDGERIMTIKKTQGDVTLTINGNANCAEVTIEELDLVGISANTSVLSGIYNIYSDNRFPGGKLTFKADSEKIKRMGLSMKDLAVLKFDVDKRKYTKIDSVFDEKQQTVSANIKEIGTYVMGVEKTVNEKATTRVFFLIDNSGSMYPKEQCPGSTENDVDFKRLSFAQSLIGRFEDGYQIGISKYTGTYTKMTGFTTDKKLVGDTLSRIKNEQEVFNGTHSQTALSSCIAEFGSDSASTKYSNIIVMLSDGESDEEGGAKLEELIKLANEKNILILTVGLGRDADRDWLQRIASGTRGKYYSASDANALDDVYKNIVTSLNYEIVSYSGRDDIKGYSLYNTGFDPKKNGFAFKNFRTATTSSVDFGMAVMARDWYVGNLKTSLPSLKPADESDQKVSADGYDIKGQAFGDIYEQRRELHAVNSDLFSGKYSDVTKYLDFSSSGDTLLVDEDSKSDALSKGWKITNSPIEGSSLKWNSVDFLSLDIADSYDKIESGYDKNSAEFAKALYRLNSLQWDDSDKEFKLTDKDAFPTITKQLSLGVPVVTTIDGTHTINAIGLIQDSLCHRKYILQVYDNNYPDEKKELYLEKKMILRLKISDGVPTIEKTDFTYSAKYEGKQVGLSFSGVEEH